MLQWYGKVKLYIPLADDNTKQQVLFPLNQHLERVCTCMYQFLDVAT